MSDWSFGAVGDVFHRDDPEDAFKYSSNLLHKIDLVFSNCEGAYTDQTETAPSAGSVWSGRARRASDNPDGPLSRRPGGTANLDRRCEASL